MKHTAANMDLKAKVASDSGEVSYGFAKHLRDAIPMPPSLVLPAHQ